MTKTLRCNRCGKWISPNEAVKRGEGRDIEWLCFQCVRTRNRIDNTVKKAEPTVADFPFPEKVRRKHENKNH